MKITARNVTGRLAQQRRDTQVLRAYPPGDERFADPAALYVQGCEARPEVAAHIIEDVAVAVAYFNTEAGARQLMYERAFGHGKDTCRSMLWDLFAEKEREMDVISDLIQETALRAWDWLPTWDGAGEFSTWLHTVGLAVRRYHMQALSAQKRGTLITEGGFAAYERYPYYDQLVKMHNAAKSGPYHPATDELLIAGETEATVQAEVDALPPKQRAAWKKRHDGGLDAAGRKSLERARKKLGCE